MRIKWEARTNSYKVAKISIVNQAFPLFKRVYTADIITIGTQFLVTVKGSRCEPVQKTFYDEKKAKAWASKILRREAGI